MNGYQKRAQQIETYLKQKYQKKGNKNFHFKVKNLRKTFPGPSFNGHSITKILIPKGTVINIYPERSHSYTYKTNFNHKEKK